jgi:hypothetical protein
MQRIVAPDSGPEDRDFSQKRDAGVGKPISRQKSAATSAAGFFLRITVVHPSSPSSSRA